MAQKGINGASDCEDGDKRSHRLHRLHRLKGKNLLRCGGKRFWTWHVSWEMVTCGRSCHWPRAVSQTAKMGIRGATDGTEGNKWSLRLRRRR